ncbi:serum opacification factor [Streptococcus uberis]|uniref:serum opacification factor n=1 Tax=Streptococcus uberis TaxID=1349 RepID=UPI0022B87FB0|nr:serum opacification factor [Streptococcus uberis]MCZ8466847.1 serum opacification factor [Streptococcus uberis]
MTTTVLGEENTTITPTTEVTTENQNATNSEINKEELTNPKTDEVVEETPTSPPVSSSLATEPKSDETEFFNNIKEGDNSVISDQTEDASTASQAISTIQPRSRSIRSLTETTQTMEVEKLQINKEKSEIRLVDGENGNKKLIANRDGKNREIADISREVKLNDAQDELEVTLKVTPKQIDEGASVIVLLDTSQKMTDEDYNTAKENIKKLVATLTGNSDKENNVANYHNRNSVRLIGFYRHISNPVDLSGKTDIEIEKTFEELRKKAKDDYNGWGVDLQGAIHKAREIFNSDLEKKIGKRQHIVLFSQGEATQSYDIKDKNKLKQIIIKDPVTGSNPLLPWPFYLDYTNRRANLVDEGQKFQDILKQLGIKRYNGLLDGLAKSGNSFFNIGSNLLGTNNPLDYLTLADLDTSSLSESSFNYSKKIGDGYHHRSYYARETSEVPLKNIVREAVKAKIEGLKKEAEKNYTSYDIFGLSRFVNSLSKKIGFDTLEEKIINKVIDNLFYKRNYIYYNHNLSAQAEAKIAREEGITFYAFDVTKPELYSNRKKEFNNKEISEEYNNYLEKKYEKESEDYKKRNNEFDKYLKAMTEGQDFLKDISMREKFQDFLSEIVIKDTLGNKVTLIDINKLKNNEEIKHFSASTSFFWGASPESLTWTISKEKLKDAFEQRRPLELTYKLKVDKDKFTPIPRTRAKRSVEATNNNNSVTAKIITSEVSYKINNKSGKATKLDDVTLTFSKELVPVPEIIEEIVPIPHKPESSLVEPEVDSILPLIPLQPSLPIYPTPELPEMEQPDQDSPEISGQSQIVDIVEDTLPGVSGQHSSSEETEISEDTRPETDNEIIVGGQSELVDIVEDTQSGMSGQHSSSEETEISEDTRPETDNEIIVGGQSELVDIVEDTQPSLSGHQSESQETVTVEDTQPNQTNILIGGQSEIVDIIEDTQAGMTGQYSSTDQLTIVEDTLPEQMEETDEIKADSQVMDIPKVNDTNNDKGAKASVAFDVEESKVVSTQDIKPSTYVKGDNQLPQTGDDDKVNAFFTLAALSVIGAAGLRQNKRREKERN